MARRGARLSEPESYWLIPGRLMGGEWPAPYLDWLEVRGIAVLINLTERQYRDDRFRIHRIPMPDGAAPEETQITRFCLLVRGSWRPGTQSMPTASRAAGAPAR